MISPQMSNEALYLLKRVLAEQLPGAMVAFSTLNGLEPTEDDILRKADKNPNTAGAEMLGLTTSNTEIKDQKAVLDAAAAGKLSALVVVAHDPAGQPDIYGDNWKSALAQIPFKVYVGSNANETSKAADIVLPLATFAEREGTVTNFAGRVQLQPAGVRSAWRVITRLETDSDSGQRPGR